jgi:hypothetical protein
LRRVSILSRVEVLNCLGKAQNCVDPGQAKERVETGLRWWFGSGHRFFAVAKRGVACKRGT